MTDKGDIITKYTSNITDVKVDFTLTIKDLDKLEKSGNFYQKLKLVSKLSTKNMHLYNSNGNIKKYYSVNEILEEFYQIRMKMYEKRKEYIINKINHELNLLKYKVKFIQYILDEKIIINRQKKETIIEKLKEFDFPELAPDFTSKNSSYDYLTNMYLFSLTQDRIDELENRLKNKESELQKVIDTTIIDQWKLELDELLEKYINKMNADKPAPKKIAKKVKK